MRLLLVEDDPSNQVIAATILETAGYEVVSCSNGQEALDCLFERNERFDGVISDLLMPLVDGKGLARRIRAAASTRSMPIVCVSALTAKEVFADALEAGCDVCVRKPYSRMDLLTAVEDALNGCRGR